MTIANPKCENVTVDGVEYLPKNHIWADGEDTNLYLYLTCEAHTITVGNTTMEYGYDAGFYDINTTTDLTVTGDGLVPGEDFTYERGSGIVTIKSPKEITIANTNPKKATTDRIVIQDSVSANVILAGVNIDLSQTGNSVTFGLAALEIGTNSTANVTITLADGTNNILKSGYGTAGLMKAGEYISDTQGKLVICGGEKGTGSLVAEGGYCGAGIGGGYDEAGSNIVIRDVAVTAKGGKYGAGIGGGYYGAGSHIIINGGSVKADGGESGKDIGGGYKNDSVVPTNDGETPVYLMIIKNPDNKTVKINGNVYPLNNHSAAENDDTNLYVYLEENNYDVTVGTTTKKYAFDDGFYAVNEMPGLKIKGTGLVSGEDYIYHRGSGILTILSDKKIQISNASPSASTTDRIYVEESVSANIVLDGVHIDVSKMDETPAFKIADSTTGNVTITLADNTANILKSGKYCAGIEKTGDYISETEGKLTICGGVNNNGELIATGGKRAAGIGGKRYKGGRNITIAGGIVTAEGGECAAGIGGGDGGPAAYITITGGTVNAKGGEVGAGIGGGDEKRGSNITITGGTVTAKGGEYAAGIGGGDYGQGTDIAITGGTVTAKGGDCAAGIGGGVYAPGPNISITDGVIIAEGGIFAAGIGGGDYGQGTDIAITGGTVTTKGGDYGAGIGGGDYGQGTDIAITGGTVTSEGGYYGAGIGGGSDAEGRNIVIKGGSVKVIPGHFGNAIGGGDGYESVKPTDENNILYPISIKNAKSEAVYIDGSEDAYIPSNHMAADEEDTNLYLYLTAAEHTVKVGSKTITIKYNEETDKLYEENKECDLIITGTDLKETDYSYDTLSNVLTINTDKKVTLSGSTIVDRVEVASGINANIVFSNLSIISSGYAAFKIADNSTGNVTITLADGTKNVLKSGDFFAGLQKNGVYISETEGKLTIQGDKEGTGTLRTSGGIYAAGIGGGYQGPGSNITVRGAIITVEGGDYGAGIGGGYQGPGSNIVIDGGSVLVDALDEENKFGGGFLNDGVVPTKDGKTPVYPLIIDNPDDETVTIDGKKYTPNHHVDIDGNITELYVYLTGEDHTVMVGQDEYKVHFHNGKLVYGLTAQDFTFKRPTKLVYTGSALAMPKNIVTGVEGIGRITAKYYHESDPGTALKAPVDAGMYTVVIDVSGGIKYAPETDITDSTWTFEVKKAEAVLTIDNSKKTYVKKVTDSDFVLEGITTTSSGEYVYTVADGVTLDGTAKAADSIIKVSEDGVVTILGTGIANVYVGVTETNNYFAVKPQCIPITVDTVDGFFVEGEKEYTYTGKAIKPALTVYDGLNGELVAKKDYTVSYKNNTKAYTLKEGEEGFDATKAPQAIIKGKGSYSEKITVYFTIQPKDISELEDESIVVKEILLEANGRVQKKVPSITYNKKKLSGVLKPEDGSAPAKVKDFVYSYPELADAETKDKAFKEAGTWKILVEGTGNYKGSRYVDIIIAAKGGKMSSAKIKRIPAQEYTGEAIDLTVDELQVTAKIDGKTTILERGTHYTVNYKNNTEIGTATVILTGIPKNGFSGKKTASFKITGTSIAKAKVEGIATKVYNGCAQTQDVVVSLSKKIQTENGIRTQTITLIKDVDYTISYDKNVNVGTAKMTVKGIGAYAGTIKKTFKITAYDMTGETDAAGNTKKDSLLTETNGLFEMTNGELSVKYVKGGAKPVVKLVFNGKPLTEGKDYTVSYKNNKNVYTLAEGDEGYKAKKAPALTIKGKGNFKGNVSKTYVITGRSLAEEGMAVTMTVNDKAVNTKKGGYISKPVLTDADGKALKQGKDYTAPVYTMKGDNGETIILSKNDKVTEAGSVITVTVKGLGAYMGTEEAFSASYRITVKNFGSIKAASISKAYTGSKVTLTEDDFYSENASGEKISKITIGSGKNKVYLQYGVDFEIVPGSYKNNVKKGTASVTLRGISETTDGGSGLYGGTKTIKFKIGTRGFGSWFWWRGL